LANTRFAAISAELLRYGIIASQTNMAGGLPDRAIIQSGRYMVTLPACPNWSKQPSLGFTNTLSSNFGCATATDLGMMVAYPADLAQGRPRGYADAIPEAAAVQRYEADKVVLPSAASLGPIAGTSAGPTGGGTGAGSAGSQP
jgi:pilus assembly protein CpaD